MGMEGFDPVQYRAGARREWDSVASGRRKRWPTIERGAICAVGTRPQ